MAVSAGRWGSPWGCGFPLEAEDVVKAMARPWLLCAARDAAPIICGTPPWNDARWYDPAGNRQPADNHSYNTYNAANMLTASNGSTYTNDLNGNTVTGGGRTSIWDSQNRLVQTTFNGVTTGFTSGPDGLRRTATTGGVTTQYILDGQNVAQEVNPAGTVRYIWGPRGPECRIDASGDPLWFLYDGHGNVIAEAGEPDQYGNPIKGMRNYGPWGGSTQSGTLESSLAYCGALGHPTDPTGLIYMRARYYDPLLGRFISEDPAKDGGNWYAYAGGDPVGMVDPDGQVFQSDSFWQQLGLYMMAQSLVMSRQGWQTFAQGRASAEMGRELAFTSGMTPLAGAVQEAHGHLLEALGGIQQKRGLELVVYSALEAFVGRFMFYLGEGVEDFYGDLLQTLATR